MVLWMTLVFIYAIFFGVHGDDIKKHTQALAAQVAADSQKATDSGDMAVQAKPAKELLDTGIEPAKIDEEAQKTILAQQAENDTDTKTAISPRPQDLPGRQFHSFQELFEQGTIDESEQIDLQGTWKREGYLKSLEATQLDQYAQYILKDMDNTHYIFLGDYDPKDLEATIKAKWGSVVAIEGKTAISQNQLRGDKIVFINLPDFKGIKVLMLVFFEKEHDVRFMQIDNDTYYAKKKEFGKLFEPWYTR